MGLLLLLTFTLLSSYFHPGRLVDAQRSFAIRKVILSIEPSPDVTRDTNVTLRCKATVSSSGQETLSREYTIYKDSNKIYTKTSSTLEDVLYPLSEARVSNTGKYKCMISIEGKNMTSSAVKLTVQGLSPPDLHLNTLDVVNEGEEITARCIAPGETGSFFFYFYEDSKEIAEKQVNINQAEVKLRLKSVGIRRIHCAYTVLITHDSDKSIESNVVTVSVRELPITAVLEIFPQSKIYEGDQLFITCTATIVPQNSENIYLYLSQGNKLLRSGINQVNHSVVALTRDPAEFECRVEMEHVVKMDTRNISVTELFSVPTLTMSPAEVFQRDHVTLTCKSESSAPERLGREKLTYTLDPPESLLIPKSNGVFFGKAIFDFNYTCIAQAKGVVKHSATLTVHPKVSVSIPKISVVTKTILGQPFQILCQSDIGSLPINYTLLKEYTELDTITVKQPFEQAFFSVTITKPHEIGHYMCQARNRPREAPLSSRLKANVTEPLMYPTLTVIPSLAEISEGDDLYLICGVHGSPPVTFMWYRVGRDEPLDTIISNKNNTDYQVHRLSKEHSGTYYCEAANDANGVRSEPVTIEVRLALWKKVLIGSVCLLALSVLVVVCVVCFKSKRGKREAAAELSVKPSSPKSDDSLTATLTHDTEVYNAVTVRVDRAAVSVWSERKPEAADDEESSVISNEPDVEYTEVVHPRASAPARVPLKKGTDTVYSELQNGPHAETKASAEEEQVQLTIMTMVQLSTLSSMVNNLRAIIAIQS